MKKRVAIIGAGVSGLAAIKCCLDEELEPVCFERSGDIGGLWNYEEGLKYPERTNVSSGIVSIICKELACYSDFPVPKEYPLYLPHAKMLQYLRSYADKFYLVKHVHFYVEVTKVTQANDFSKTGNWSVTCKNLKTGEAKEEILGGVLMCTGGFSEGKLVKYEGQEEFEGKIIHSQNYRSYKDFENKTVVVVGIKSSGADIASELSGVGCQVYVSSRRGVWICGRLMNGVPSDLVLSNRLLITLNSYLPQRWTAEMVKRNLNQRFNHKKFGLEPNHLPGLYCGGVSLSEILPERMMSGKIVMKPKIRRLGKNSVEFVDGSVVENVAGIIQATGYRVGLPYLDCGSFKVTNNNIDLYKTMFSPDIHPSTIALIGGASIIGGVAPYVEMQCRVAVRVIKGGVKLPDGKSMWCEINARKSRIDGIRKQLGYDHADIDCGYMLDYYTTTMTALAELCDCQPTFCEYFWLTLSAPAISTFIRLLRMDRRLAWQYLFGPALPAQFRLCGHGALAEAKDTLLASEERLRFPFPKPFEVTEQTNHRSKFKLLIVPVIFLMVLTLLFV